VTRALSAARLGAFAVLVRAPAALTVPGDTLAGAAAAGLRLRGRRLLLPLASTCLYWAGMALNDYADRRLDAVERPERPVPSGRVRPAEALAVATGLTGAGVALAAAGGGRPALRVALPLAAAVWAYDLALKRSPLGPVAMAACRGLDVLLGAAGAAGAAAAAPRSERWDARVALRGRWDARAPGGGWWRRRIAERWDARVPSGERWDARVPGGRWWRRRIAERWDARVPSGEQWDARAPGRGGAGVLTAAAALAGHTAVVTVLARGEVHGAPPAVARLACGGTALVAAAAALAGPAASPRHRVLGALAAAAYALPVGRAQWSAARDPSAAACRRATVAGIHGMVPLQAALAAREGSVLGAAAVLAAAPVASAFARVVSPT